jgi:hypothetical protein
MNKILFFLFCLVGTFFPFKTIDAKMLHAILVADTVHDLCSVTKPDLHRWQNELKVIAQHSQLILKEKIFSGPAFCKEEVQKYLQTLVVNQADTVIFYFSGHGYRTAQKKTPWPFLTFEFYKPGLDVQWVADTIRSKKPRFALVMSDCCNNYAENGLFETQTKQIQINLHQLTPHYMGYRQLFSRAKGCIVISSCSAGQFSYGSHLGGLYTQCFFTSLNRELKEESPSWKNLLQRANGYIQHIQRPICQVYR